MGSVSHFICQKLLSLLSVSLHFLQFFSFISTYFSRLERKETEVISAERNQKETISCEAEKKVSEFRGVEDYIEEEKPEFFLKFKFPTFEEFSGSNKVKESLFNSEIIPFGSTNNHEFIYGNCFGSFVDEQGTSRTKDEIYRNGDSPESSETVVVEVFSDESSEKVRVLDEVKHDWNNVVCDGKENQKNEPAKAKEKFQDFLDDCQFHSDEISMFTDSNSDSDSESTSFGHMRSVVSSTIDGFLSDGDFGGENQEPEVHEENDIKEEQRTLEEDTSQDPGTSNLEFLSENDFNEDLEKTENGKADDEGITSEDNSEDHESKDSSSNRLESLWEHQEMIEQLKMELRKVKATGLPTIFEESEPPKMESLKPWKIDENLVLEDCIDELHKFSKCYSVRMRKFDILNYQKMYATGFLQLKEPLQSVSKVKFSGSISTLKSLLSQNLRFSKHGSHEDDPMKKFIKELQSDLEVVYVGQMCLTWEFLHWQYAKALDLWDSDPHGIRHYNEVAGEFQQFQVLLQRFIEDEPFQGPRVQHYSNSRCVFSNLLQVPVIREDRFKDKCKAIKKHEEENVVTSDMLVEIVGESIRIFWQFVEADKDCTIETNKRPTELHNPEDLQLLIEIRKNLQKMERKLKDIVRSERCILRKFRQCPDKDSKEVLYYFGQLDMKLVSRVINMSKLTRDQLMWCHNKLNKISIEDRKICVEPSFLLFPC